MDARHPQTCPEHVRTCLIHAHARACSPHIHMKKNSSRFASPFLPSLFLSSLPPPSRPPSSHPIPSPPLPSPPRPIHRAGALKKGPRPMDGPRRTPPTGVRVLKQKDPHPIAHLGSGIYAHGYTSFCLNRDNGPASAFCIHM